LAKYPETTTFYPAEVMESRNGRCMLCFEGEEEIGKLTPVDRVFVLPCPK
jgi:SAGA-associated factor 29